MRGIGSTNFGRNHSGVVQQDCATLWSPTFSFVSSQHQSPKGRSPTIPHPKKLGTEMSLPHSKKRRTEMSQDLNLFTTASRSSGSSAYAGSFSNNTNSFNNTTNVNYFAVPGDRSEILAWLSPLEPRARHRNLEASRVDKVGDWLLQTEQFQSWSGGNSQGESQNATMFCYGNPGAGKTYIW